MQGDEDAQVLLYGRTFPPKPGRKGRVGVIRRLPPLKVTWSPAVRRLTWLASTERDAHAPRGGRRADGEQPRIEALT